MCVHTDGQQTQSETLRRQSPQNTRDTHTYTDPPVSPPCYGTDLLHHEPREEDVLVARLHQGAELPQRVGQPAGDLGDGACVVCWVSVLLGLVDGWVGAWIDRSVVFNPSTHVQYAYIHNQKKDKAYPARCWRRRGACRRWRAAARACARCGRRPGSSRPRSCRSRLLDVIDWCV